MIFAFSMVSWGKPTLAFIKSVKNLKDDAIERYWMRLKRLPEPATTGMRESDPFSQKLCHDEMQIRQYPSSL